MILYALACDNGHRFESWFPGSAAFDEQAARKLVACPICRSTAVAKTIMAPAVLGRVEGPSAAPPPDAETGPAVAPALLDPARMAARSFVKAIRERVLSEAEDVGDKFPDQARKMHDGDIPHRHIHGQATLDEARALLEDGVAIMPLPVPPDELN
jgi:hypothetical protein